MSQTLIIGDLHYRKSTYDNDMRILEDEILGLVDKYAPHSVVLLGDIFHDHANVDLSVFSSCMKFLELLAIKCTKLIIILGNHDRISNKDECSDVHIFHGLSRANVHIISKPTIIDGVMYVPFVKEGSFIQCIRTHVTETDFKNVRLVYAHQELKGVKLTEHIISRSKDVWPEDCPLLISGHIHTKQWVAKNIFYPGTPISHDFGDLGEKYVHLINSELQITDINIVSVPRRIKLSVTNISDVSGLTRGNYYKIYAQKIDNHEIYRELIATPRIQVHITTSLNTLKNDNSVEMPDNKITYKSYLHSVINEDEKRYLEI